MKCRRPTRWCGLGLQVRHVPPTQPLMFPPQHGLLEPGEILHFFAPPDKANPLPPRFSPNAWLPRKSSICRGQSRSWIIHRVRKPAFLLLMSSVLSRARNQEKGALTTLEAAWVLGKNSASGPSSSSSAGTWSCLYTHHVYRLVFCTTPIVASRTSSSFAGSASNSPSLRFWPMADRQSSAFPFQKVHGAPSFLKLCFSDRAQKLSIWDSRKVAAISEMLIFDTIKRVYWLQLWYVGDVCLFQRSLDR